MTEITGWDDWETPEVDPTPEVDFIQPVPPSGALEAIAMFMHEHNAEKLKLALEEAGLYAEIVPNYSRLNAEKPDYYVVKTQEADRKAVVEVREILAGSYDERANLEAGQEVIPDRHKRNGGRRIPALQNNEASLRPKQIHFPRVRHLP